MSERPTSSALRQSIIDGWVTPRARAMLEYAPEAQSVVFLVAQFWDDNAEFELHWEFIACADRDPVWPELMDFEKNPIGDPEDADDCAETSAYWAQEKLRDRTFRARTTIDQDLINEFRAMVVAFASFCKEGATQNDSPIDNYTPYCVVRRGGDGSVEVEIVGKLLRPAWENCWELIDLDEALDRAGVDKMLKALGGLIRSR